MKISFDLNISLDKDKKEEAPNAVAAVPASQAASLPAETGSEEKMQLKAEEPVQAAKIASEPAQCEAKDAEKEAPSKLDKVIDVVKDGKDLYDNSKEALEMVSAIKTRGIISGACIVLSVLMIIITPIFCHYWPQYQLKNRVENTVGEVRDKAMDNAMDVLENGKNLAAEKKNELDPKIDEVKDELGAKLDNAKAQAADKLDNAEKALDAKLDSAKKWLKGDDAPSTAEPAENAK